MGPTFRLYLTGRLSVEMGDQLLDEAMLTRQARLMLTYLALERLRPVSREELADTLWGEDPPDAPDAGLNALASNLRSFLGLAGLDRNSIERLGTGYQLRLPGQSWVDIEAGVGALDQAEGAIRSSDPLRAWGHAGIATAVGRRPFLPGAEGAWVEGQRTRLRDLLYRGLDCFAQICPYLHEVPLALRAAEEMIELEPFRESAYRRLMQIHLDTGNRAEALRVYGRCRRLLAHELGTDPSPPTEALYLSALSLA